MHTWQWAVLLTVVFGYIVQPILIKKVVHIPGRARNLVFQYFFTTGLVLAAGILANRFFDIYWHWDAGTLIVFFIGAVNAFACYCHWRAAAINLAVTSVSTWADDVIGMTLGYLFLQELEYLNPLLMLGIGLTLFSIVVFISTESQPEKTDQIHFRKIFFWIALYSFIWGGAQFSMRYFALQNMSVWNYVTAWYVGAFLGACVVFPFAGKEEQGAHVSLAPLQIAANVLPLSLAICISLPLLYWARMLAPLTISTPLFQVSEMIFPTLVGLIIFKEHKKFTARMWLAMTIGIVGSAVIIIAST